MTDKQYRLTTENMKWFVQQKLEPSGDWINISKHFSEEAARAKINELIEQQIKDSIKIDVV